MLHGSEIGGAGSCARWSVAASLSPPPPGRCRRSMSLVVAPCYDGVRPASKKKTMWSSGRPPPSKSHRQRRDDAASEAMAEFDWIGNIHISIFIFPNFSFYIHIVLFMLVINFFKNIYFILN
jgi:hypothetical protein